MSIDKDIQKLYIGYFGRPADPIGMAYWERQLGAGQSMEAVGAAFAKSAEFVTASAGKTPAQIINQAYQNLFGHDADAQGARFWSARMESGDVSVSTMIDAIAHGARGSDTVALQDKAIAAASFSAALDALSESQTVGADALALGHAILAGVKDDATLAHALASVADAFAHLAAPPATPLLVAPSLSDPIAIVDPLIVSDPIFISGPIFISDPIVGVGPGAPIVAAPLPPLGGVVLHDPITGPLQVLPYFSGGGAFVGGTDAGELIDLPVLLAGVPQSATSSNYVNPGDGDDRVIGSPWNDGFAASTGNDSIDGGAGRDGVDFTLFGNKERLSQGVDADGNQIIKLGASTIFTIADQHDGTFLVTGANFTPGAWFGTELLRNIEELDFINQGTGQYLAVGLGAQVVEGVHVSHSGLANWAEGSAANDTIDLARLFPEVKAGLPNAYVAGVQLDPGAGDDHVAGTPGVDQFFASAGADSIDGAAGVDTLNFVLPGMASAKLSQEVGAHGDLLLKADGVSLFNITRAADGSFLISGVAGTAGAAFGSEHISNIENLLFDRGADDGSGNLKISLALQVWQDAATPFNGQPGLASAQITGSIFGERIDAPALLTGHLDMTMIDPGAGDDVVIGSAADDWINASAGADMIDGGAGSDTLNFIFPAGTDGALSQSTDANGNMAIKLGSVTVLTVAPAEGGWYRIDGVAGTPGAGFGSELAHNMEFLQFIRYTNSDGSFNLPGTPGAVLEIALDSHDGVHAALPNALPEAVLDAPAGPAELLGQALHASFSGVAHAMY
ncbi:MAG: DUF4214 domain-containing protein [Pseudomonadota bacterium]